MSLFIFALAFFICSPLLGMSSQGMTDERDRQFLQDMAERERRR